MGCGEELAILLSKYVDNEVTPEERGRVEGHLSGCEECRNLLSIFLRNESILSNALATGEFRQKVVDQVMERIEEPPEAEPADESWWDRVSGFFRERPWTQIAAAAVLLVGLVAVLMASHARKDKELREELSALRARFDRVAGAEADRFAREQERTQSLLARWIETHRRSWAARIQNANDIRGNSSAAAFIYNYIVVSAKFVDPKQYVSFEVLKSENEGKSYHLLKKGLEEARYEDDKVTPGKYYFYKFAAWKRNRERVESVPVRLQAPLRSGLDPEKCFKIHCTDVGPKLNVATFAVTRHVNGRAVTYTFTVNMKEALGARVRTPIGEVDFGTHMTAENAGKGDETITATFAWPKFDPKTGEPIMRTATQQAYELKDQIIGAQENSYVTLRSATGQSYRIWKGGSVLVPIE